MRGEVWADGKSNDTSCGLEITSPVALMEWIYAGRQTEGQQNISSVTVRAKGPDLIESHLIKWNHTGQNGMQEEEQRRGASL